jgi:hypothetical protein
MNRIRHRIASSLRRGVYQKEQSRVNEIFTTFKNYFFGSVIPILPAQAQATLFRLSKKPAGNIEEI